MYCPALAYVNPLAVVLDGILGTSKETSIVNNVALVPSGALGTSSFVQSAGSLGSVPTPTTSHTGVTAASPESTVTHLLE